MKGDVRGYSGRLAPTVTVWMWSLLALMGVASPTLAADEGAAARAWLERIVTAALSLSYEGTFIYRRDDQLVAMSVIHVADGRGERERLIALSGRQREIIRDADGMVCMLPEQQQIRSNKAGINKPFPPRSFENIASLEKYYRFSLGGTERIAGRSARMVVIEPRDSYRYGYRLWVDETSGLLLQSDMVDESGAAVEQMMFTQLAIVNEVTPAMASAVVITEEMRKAMAKSTPQRQLISSNATLSWRIGPAPAGFKLTERYRHRSRGGPLLEQGVLTDGMASVSVFVEPMDSTQPPFQGLSHRGAVSAYGAVVNGRQLTVVGEVPVNTVQLIGRVITFDERADSKN